MAEQFLRIGGTDGNIARGIRTDSNGNVLTTKGDRFFNVDGRSQKNKILNGVVSHSETLRVIDTYKSCVIDSITLTFDHKEYSYFVVGVFNKTLSVEYLRIYRPSLGSYTPNIRPSLLDTINSGAYSNEFELVLFDEKRDIYIVRNRYPIYCPNGLILALYSEADTKIAYNLKYREARDND